MGLEHKQMILTPTFLTSAEEIFQVSYYREQ